MSLHGRAWKEKNAEAERDAISKVERGSARAARTPLIPERAFWCADELGYLIVERQVQWVARILICGTAGCEVLRGEGLRICVVVDCGLGGN